MKVMRLVFFLVVSFISLRASEKPDFEAIVADAFDVHLPNIIEFQADEEPNLTDVAEIVELFLGSQNLVTLLKFRSQFDWYSESRTLSENYQKLARMVVETIDSTIKHICADQKMIDQISPCTVEHIALLEDLETIISRFTQSDDDENLGFYQMTKIALLYKLRGLRRKAEPKIVAPVPPFENTPEMRALQSNPLESTTLLTDQLFDAWQGIKSSEEQAAQLESDAEKLQKNIHVAQASVHSLAQLASDTGQVTDPLHQALLANQLLLVTSAEHLEQTRVSLDDVTREKETLQQEKERILQTLSKRLDAYHAARSKLGQETVESDKQIAQTQLALTKLLRDREALQKKKKWLEEKIAGHEHSRKVLAKITFEQFWEKNK